MATAHTVAVRPSMAIELEWVLHSALRDDFRADHSALRAVYDARPDLLEDVTALWPAAEDATTGQFTELVVLAHHGGLLFGDDPEPLLEALPRLAGSVPTTERELPLRAETDADRAIVLDRLAHLRRSPAVARRYAEVVRRVWDAVAGPFERQGRSAVADTVGTLQSMVDKGVGWRDLAKGAYQFGDAAERAVAALPEGAEIVVVPAYFAHLGLLYDLPGVIVLGIAADESGQAARERNEALARQLRALCDPTRLAVVDLLRTAPRTITELATRFGLAQPTVSNHVKLLKEAGLVGDEREGTRRNLVVRSDAGNALAQELAHRFSVRGGDSS